LSSALLLAVSNSVARGANSVCPGCFGSTTVHKNKTRQGNFLPLDRSMGMVVEDSLEDVEVYHFILQLAAAEKFNQPARSPRGVRR
jgi:hypothetical protein